MSESPVHPLVDHIAQLIARNGGPPHQLDAEAVAILEAELAKLAGSAELRVAVADLIKLACHLDTRAESPEAAEAILRVLQSSVDPLRALEARDGQAMSAVAEEVAAAKRELDRFRGSEDRPKAPKIGEGAPEGSVKLGSLDYPKRG